MYKMAKELYYEQKHISDIMCDDEKAAAAEYSKGYMAFLDNGKTERECVSYAIELAKGRLDRNFVEVRGFGRGW